MKNSLLILLILSLSAFTIGDGHYFDIKEGNENYKKGEYDKALKLYDRAFARKESAVSKYNLGNAHYRKGEYDSAAQSFLAMLDTKDSSLAGNGLWNFAASNLMAGLEKAAGADAQSALANLIAAAAVYKDILLDDPSDKKAKENLELALNKIREIEKQRPKQKGEGEEPDEKENSDSGEESGEENRQNEEPQQEEAKEEDNKSGEEKQAENAEESDKNKSEQARDAGREKRKGKMSPEEVTRILKALAQNEEKLQKEFHRMKTREKGVEKDW